MKSSNDISSYFANTPSGENGVASFLDNETPKQDVDFEKAKLLSNEGTTCDTYLIRRNHKLLLIKRLKEEHRFKPRHRSAIAKEFELGYRLRHQNLPVYLECGEDYLVMDYVEGDTLRKLMDQDDIYLHKPENLRRIFEQLIDVVDYLHHENVTHCDIKADNVMLTLRNHNLMLIDLGNAYADWHPMTAGAARAYGVESGIVGSTDIDFHGIGRIVDNLSAAGFNTHALQRFRSLCDKEGVTADQLREALTKRNHSWMYTVGGIIIASIITLIGAWIITPRHNNVSGKDADTSATHPKDTVVIITPSTADYIETTVNIDNAGESKPQLHVDYKNIINREMSQRMESLDVLLKKYEAIVDNPEVTNAELMKAVNETVHLSSRLTQETYIHYQEQFPDIPAIEVQMAVANTPVYQQLLSRQSTLFKAIVDHQRQSHPEPSE